MGANSSSRSDTSQLNDDDVNFDHFQILRAIGKGSFGKVCIVQKRDSGVLYAMKYVSRNACESRGALGGVIKEVDLLSTLEHPFLVNLWFSFQDEEDLFMVCDLLTGGDLRYHLQNRVEFSEESVALFVCELGSVLDYLQTNRVVHRDIKPDNILLDDAGHAHLTDFNIATRIAKDSLACSMSGTKPYMAPEVFMTALEEVTGYSYPVDWWSLGVVAYEMRANQRPFAVHSNTTLVEVKNLLTAPVHYPRYWSRDFVDLLQKLLCVHPGGRISTQQELQQTPLLRHVNFKDVLDKKRRPPFKPPEDHLNCDPCLELEEMIVETRPLHKKKKRLAKQRSAQRELDSTAEPPLVKEFIIYNRFKELKRKAMEKKENDWQRELEQAMANSIVNCLAPIQEKPTKETQTTPTTTGDAEAPAEAVDAPTITRSQLNEMIDGAMAQVRSKCQYPKDVPTSSCSKAEQPGRRLEAANFDDEKPCCSKAALRNLKAREPGSSGQARPNFPDEKPSTSKASASKSRSNKIPNSSSRKAPSDDDREKQTTTITALRTSPVVETEPIDFIDRTPSPQAPGAQILTSAQVAVGPVTPSEASAQTPAAPLSRGPSTQPLDRTLRSAAVQTPTSLDAQLHA